MPAASVWSSGVVGAAGNSVCADCCSALSPQPIQQLPAAEIYSLSRKASDAQRSTVSTQGLHLFGCISGCLVNKTVLMLWFISIFFLFLSSLS